MQQVKYRLVDPRLAPRRTKLEMPGWAGPSPNPAATARRNMPGIARHSPKARNTGLKSFIRMTTSFASAEKAASLFLTAISDHALRIAGT
jgi:hypothetical protein